MKTKKIIGIIKDILIKTCIYFTVMTLIIHTAATFFNLPISPGTYFVFALSAFGAGIAVQIFKIDKIPMASRHIAFFIILYLDFLLIFVPLSEYTATQTTTLYLSLIFIAIYLVILGIIMGIKAIVNTASNKKLKYDNQFDNVK